MGLFSNSNAAVVKQAATTSKQQSDLAYSLAKKKATEMVGAVDKNWVGLGNVDNTSDANKPVSTAQLAALNGKANTIHTHAITDVTGLSSALSGLSAAAASKLSIAELSTIATDAAATVAPSVTNAICFHTGSLTAARTITIATAGVTIGSVIRFVRTGAGAFNLSIGGLKNLASNTWCDVVFNGSAWALTAYGTL